VEQDFPTLHILKEKSISKTIGGIQYLIIINNDF